MKRKITVFFCAAAFLFLIAVYTCNKIIVDHSRGKTYSDVADIPFNKTGLLLGTSKFIPGGGANPYYAFRIRAAVRLLKEGKIKYIIVSGDNGTNYYDETDSMRADLIRAGIDSTVIFPDYAGFRTFDSVVRSKEIFGQVSITIISQEFHNERAIYIASKEHIEAVGYNAADLGIGEGLKTQIREKLARIKVFLDFLFNKKPRLLGRKIQIPL